jgi:hypothetical protein
MIQHPYRWPRRSHSYKQVRTVYIFVDPGSEYTPAVKQPNTGSHDGWTTDWTWQQWCLGDLLVRAVNTTVALHLDSVAR